MPSKSPNRNFLSPRTVTFFALTPTWALSPASLLPEHSGHQQPTESFVSPQLLAILMLLLPSKSSKCFLTTVKQVPHLVLFLCSKKPPMPIPLCVYFPLSWLLLFNCDLSSPYHLFWSSYY